MVITEAQLGNIISNAANKAVDKLRGLANQGREGVENFLTGRRYKEGKPNKIIEVIDADGWELSREKPENNTFKIYHKVIGLISNPLSIDELVEDINIYLEDSGSQLRCTGWQSDDVKWAAYIRFFKK